VRRYTLTIAAGLGVFGLAAMVAHLAYEQLRERAPPMIFHNQYFEPAKARAGEAVWLVVDRTRARWCPGLVWESWVIDGTDDRLTGVVTHTSADQRVGRITSRFLKRIPVDAPPGVLCYVPALRYDCADGQHLYAPQQTCLDVVK